MVTISLCTIFRDEEEFLPEFLGLLEDSFDELVLVDTGSVDNSLKIVHERGHSTHYFSNGLITSVKPAITAYR